MLVLTIVFAMIASLGIFAKLRFVRNEKIRKEIIERREKYGWKVIPCNVGENVRSIEDISKDIFEVVERVVL